MTHYEVLARWSDLTEDPSSPGRTRRMYALCFYLLRFTIDRLPQGHPSQSQQRTNPVNFPSGKSFPAFRMSSLNPQMFPERYESDSRRGNRADEIFSALKSEFDNLQKECTSAKHARADLERQCNSSLCVIFEVLRNTTLSTVQAQILELSTIQQTLYDLQQQHLNMKQQ